MNISFCWSANTGVSICMSPLENVANEFVLTSPAVPILHALFGWFLRLEVSGRAGFFFQNLFKTALSILVSFSPSFFSDHFVRVQMQPYSSTKLAKSRKNSRFIYYSFILFFKSFVCTQLEGDKYSCPIQKDLHTVT